MYACTLEKILPDATLLTSPPIINKKITGSVTRYRFIPHLAPVGIITWEGAPFDSLESFGLSSPVIMATGAVTSHGLPWISRRRSCRRGQFQFVHVNSCIGVFVLESSCWLLGVCYSLGEFCVFEVLLFGTCHSKHFIYLVLPVQLP